MSEKRKSGKKADPAPPRTSGTSGPMDVGLLEQIVQLMAQHDLSAVDLRDGGRRVILKRGLAPAPLATISAQPIATAAPAAPSAPPASDDSKLHRIISPMVGTFYSAAKPGEKPFVSVGSRVNEETDVCIIEAMKTFNNIKAECGGVITRILVQDGQSVEFGTALFLVSPA